VPETSGGGTVAELTNDTGVSTGMPWPVQLIRSVAAVAVTVAEGTYAEPSVYVSVAACVCQRK
jgi:hypothetical protein